MAKHVVISCLLLLSVFNYGCGGAVPVIEAVGTVTSATGAYFSYKALQQDPVNVTTVAKECVLKMEYVRVNCAARPYLTPEEKDVIAKNNRTLVEICGVVKPEVLVCPTN